MPEARQQSAKGKSLRTLAEKKKPSANNAPHPSYAQFQTAVQLMQEGKYEKAHTVFEKLTHNGAPELLERCRTYLAACERQSRKVSLSFNTAEEQYDYAISLLNTGNYEDARDQFEGLLKKNNLAAYAHYGLAVLNSMTGQAEECLDHLRTAITINPQNRIQARGDADFVDMADDPRFTELLYPEALE
ncbi:MAG TPA: tetratricopeptide repeat protein [Acidobacteriaceae bacterium]|nr:tetratricopeptide repeat protein [Acidobacteriaceae bacterium]